MAERESRLVLAAKALGFNEAASSVDTLTKAQAELEKVNEELGKSSTQSVGEVAKLTERQRLLTEVVDGLKSPRDRANATERDWMGVLRQMSPAMGGYIDDLVKSAKVTRELAEAKRGLASLGAALIPILVAIGAAVRAVAEEYAQANRAIRDQAKALNELKSQERDRQQSIEDARAGTRLPIFTPEESRAASETAGRVREKFPFIAEDAVKRAVAFTGGAAGEAGGGAFGLEDIARLARLVQLAPPTLSLTDTMSPASVNREINSELARHKARLDQQFATEATQQKENAARAPVEVAQVGGSTLNLRERISRRAPEGMDIDRLVELAQKLESAGGLESFSKLLDMAISGESPSLHVLRRLSQTGGALGVDVGALDPRLGASESDVAVLRGVFAELAAEAKRATEAMKQHADTIESSPPPTVNITNQYQGAKFLVPGSHDRRRARYNGHAVADGVEQGVY